MSRWRKLLMVGVAIWLPLVGTAAVPPILFTQLPQPPAPGYGLGTIPYSVAVAALDHDRIPDLVTLNLGSSSVSVLRGKGDGTFYPATNYPVSPVTSSTSFRSPFPVVLADFNEDDHPDILTCSTTLLLGNGDGSFGASNTISVNATNLDLTVADLNGDGHLDFVVPRPSQAQVEVFFGDGSGQFPSNRAFSVDSYLPQCLAVADFNGDGRLDMVAGSNHPLDGLRSCLLNFFSGDGTGNFGPATTIDGPGLDITTITAGDLDQDGKVDLVTSVEFSGVPPGVRALRNNGDGSFSRLGSANINGSRGAITDLNGDEVPEVLCMGTATYFVQFRPGLGGGQFGAITNLSMGYTAGVVTAADLNGDGRPDLVTGRYTFYGATDLAVFLNRTAPALHIAPLPGRVRLSWPDWAFGLESRPNLSAGSDWAPAPDVPVVSGTRKVVTNVVDQPGQFYRLRQM